ncbi:MAG: hypothetical protein HQ558_00995 [Candidatus Omnitrophica bacterium]|nr:hypothetical protein [Candidatus Omnitrophota bacterium]
MRKILLAVCYLTLLSFTGFAGIGLSAEGAAQGEDEAAVTESSGTVKFDLGKTTIKDGKVEGSAKKASVNMKDAFAQMQPMISSMMDSMVGAMFKLLAKPEIAENMATFTKNYYDALIKKGFSKEEALQIVVAVGVPSAGK